MIALKEKSCKDGILIIDEFTARDKNAQEIAQLVKRLNSNNDYKYTSVILMGEYRNNSSFIKTFNLGSIFSRLFRLSFYTPSFSQIGDIFEAYAMREAGYTLTNKAKSSLIFYFLKLK